MMPNDHTTIRLDAGSNTPINNLSLVVGLIGDSAKGEVFTVCLGTKQVTITVDKGGASHDDLIALQKYIYRELF